MNNILSFNNVIVLVIGDVMLDRYYIGESNRISPEAPVPVLDIKDEFCRLGGAGNVALNIKSLGAEPILVGILGNDSRGKTIENLLIGSNIQHELIFSNECSTIEKTRIIGGNHQIVRLDFEKKYAFGEKEWHLMMQNVKKHIESVDIVIISDYCKGTLLDIQEIIGICKRFNKKVIIDPKQKDFSVYRGANIVTPNIHELEDATSKCYSEHNIRRNCKHLIEQFGFEQIILTRGKDGIFLIDKEGNVHISRQKAKSVYDVTGAGDVVVSTIGVAIASGYEMNKAIEIANIAAGISIGEIGTSCIDMYTLNKAIMSSSESKIMSLDRLKLEIESIRRSNPDCRIVFSNGCFDVIHVGHIHTLETAKSYGDILIVGINSDDSIKRIKGEKRPINDIYARTKVLSSMQFIDMISVFNEDTPIELIEAIRPDVLVKGGDYKKELIVGYDFISSYGGKIHAIPLIDGYSTTETLIRLLT